MTCLTTPILEALSFPISQPLQNSTPWRKSPMLAAYCGRCRYSGAIFTPAAHSVAQMGSTPRFVLVLVGVSANYFEKRTSSVAKKTDVKTQVAGSNSQFSFSRFLNRRPLAVRVAGTEPVLVAP